MREATLTLGYATSGLEQARPTSFSAQQMSQVVVRRTRHTHRSGSGRVTLKRSFPLEGQLLSAIEEDRGVASVVEDASVSFKPQNKSNVYQSKRRSRILDRKTGTGRSTTLRLFPLEAQEMSPKVRSPLDTQGAAHTSMDIVPYDQPVDVEMCLSPEAGFAEDNEPCFDMGSPMLEPEMEDDEGGVVAEAAAEPEVAPVKVRKPKGEPHVRLRNYYKNRKSLATHGLKIVEESGLRRSTRRRVKPLQYWRNEKVEYERQHKSLPTIASIALRSPDECWPAPNPRNKRKTKSRIKELVDNQAN